MQSDNQQPGVDPLEQGNPFDPRYSFKGERGNDVLDELENLIPGGQKYPGQAREAAAQSPESLQDQQGLGGLGDLLGNPSQQPGSASAAANDLYGDDPDNPYGRVEDIIADYGKTQNNPGQPGVTNL